ncbi:MAG: zinc ribbon domain-containing protein, partial [Gemmatimonas sp.]
MTAGPCSACGAALSPGARFCHRCGTAVAAGAAGGPVAAAGMVSVPEQRSFSSSLPWAVAG